MQSLSIQVDAGPGSIAYAATVEQAVRQQTHKEASTSQTQPSGAARESAFTTQRPPQQVYCKLDNSLLLACVHGEALYFVKYDSFRGPTVRLFQLYLAPQGMSIPSHSQDKPFALRVDGQIPRWLNGSIVRNGPGFYAAEMQHMFDGFGMLVKFVFKDGKIETMQR